MEWRREYGPLDGHGFESGDGASGGPGIHRLGGHGNGSGQSNGTGNSAGDGSGQGGCCGVCFLDGDGADDSTYGYSSGDGQGADACDTNEIELLTGLGIASGLWHLLKPVADHWILIGKIQSCTSQEELDSIIAILELQSD